MQRNGMSSEIFEEDMFLPNLAAGAVNTLPVMLRDACTTAPVAALEHALKQRNKDDRLDEMKDWLGIYAFPKKFIPDMHWRAMERTINPTLGVAGKVDSRLFLDYLPLLRNMAVQERVSDAVFLAAQQQDPDGVANLTNRMRSTRNNKKLGRKHFFEKMLPLKCNKKAKDVGEFIADASLLYE